MNIVAELTGWFADPDNWTGSEGVAVRLLEHLKYTGAALLLACLVALPAGALVGHTGRGAFVVVGLTNALRALPTLGLVIMVVLIVSVGLAPVLLALVVLAVPPVMAGAYAGIRAVDPMVVDAARGIGMREREVLLGVELPNAMPLVLGASAARRCSWSRRRRWPPSSALAGWAATSSTASRCSTTPKCWPARSWWRRWRSCWTCCSPA